MAGGGVFICCCREIRDGFPDHLCARLRAEGLRVENGAGDLPKGENLREGIRHVIENSSFSVVILSRGFASSQFRLDELVHIKEQHATGTHACLPVFFHISPDEDCATLVVDDSGSSSGSCFDGYFNRHKTQFTYQRVHAWIQALAWLARISGWVLTSGRSEAALVEEIATTIQEMIRKNELAYFSGHCRQYPNSWEQHKQKPSASTTSTGTTSTSRWPAATLSFRIVIVVAAASAFGGAAVVAIYFFVTTSHTIF